MPNLSTPNCETDLHCWVGISVKQPEEIAQSFLQQGEIDLSSSWPQCIKMCQECIHVVIVWWHSNVGHF